jgi:hypothetical protein
VTDREWGIDIGDEILDPTDDQTEAENRLNRYRDTWPHAQLATRTCSPWTTTEEPT